MAAYPRLIPHSPARHRTPPLSSLKRTEAFRVVYRRGRWGRGTLVSVGARPNGLATTRLGLRTKKGLKGAVRRNRLKRQLRAIAARLGPWTPGVDVVVVVHPPTPSVTTAQLELELARLCKRLGALS